MTQSVESRSQMMTRDEYRRSLRRRHRKVNRLVCLLVGHRWMFGVNTVPPAEIWDCRWCPKTEVRWPLATPEGKAER